METIVIDDKYETEQPFPGVVTELRIMTYQERFTFQRHNILNDGDELVKWARKLWVDGSKQPDEYGKTLKKFEPAVDLLKVNLGHLMFVMAMCYRESSLSEKERKK